MTGERPLGGWQQRPRKPMRRGGPLRRKTELPRGGALRPRSPKMAKVYRDTRVALVIALLDAFPVCQRCCAAPSVEIHELLPRGRGGSITDPENCVALCHPCHTWATVCVAAAELAGWLLKTGQRFARPVDCLGRPV